MTSTKDMVWEKGKKIRGKNGAQYRIDVYGNEIEYDQYGESTEKGWQIDHIVPGFNGGTNHIDNLRPLQTESRCRKVAFLRKKYNKPLY